MSPLLEMTGIIFERLRGNHIYITVIVTTARTH